MKTAWKTKIIRQEVGSFSRRYAIGPAKWPHFDLLWIHEGRVGLRVGQICEVVELGAPDGILICPDTPFHGQPLSTKAKASILHFETNRFEERSAPMGFIRAQEDMALHLQNLLRLSLYYAKGNLDENHRIRLLYVILDALEAREQSTFSEGRLHAAWGAAEDRLSGIRSLSDVADLVGLSESSFRVLHRATFGQPAGKHLRNLRLKHAEGLLATTGETVSEISKQVGYSSPESFSYAFKTKYGQSPREFRKWARNFA